MIQFLLLIAVLLLIVLFVLLRPLLRNHDTYVSAEELPALKILREQKADLDAERNAGRIGEEEYARTLGEIEQRALEESAVPQRVAVGGGKARAWAVSVALSITALALVFYVVLGNLPALDPQVRAGGNAPHMAGHDIDAMVAKLAQHVRDNPDDVEAAMRLGQAYMVLSRFDDAVALYSQLAAKQPQDAQTYANWADALASVQGQKLAGEPEKLIAKALQLDPRNIKALALAGTLAFEKSDFKTAVSHWEKIIGQIPPDSQLGQSLTAMLEDARQRAGMPASAALPPAQAASTLPVKGSVSLAAALKDKASADDALFIFARPAGGGPPLAGMRFRVADLPIQFDFAEAAMMMSGGALPQQIIVGARISKSGNALPRSGDLEGFTEAISPNTSNAVILIDRVVP